jgi:hypothetical protein
VATKYLTFEGYTFKSGDAPRAKAIGSKELKESFTLSSERIIYNWVVDDFRTQRLEFKGSFQYSKQGKLISGRVNDITIALKFTGTTEGTSEDIISYRVSREFGDVSNYSFFNSSAKGLDPQGIADSLNYLYTSEQNYSYNTAGERYPQPPHPDKFPNNTYTLDRGVVDKATFPDGWWNNPFASSAASSQSPLTGTAKKADVFALTGTPEFGAGTADRITNFNPKEKDRVQIDVSDFGSNAAGTFRVAKKAKAFTKALASTTDFIYLKSTGELYYNENGNLPGYGDGGIFAIIENKANITTKNVEFL